MKKTRWMLMVTVLMVAAALGFGLLGVYSKVAVQAQGSVIPEVIHYLPEDSDVVAYINVRNLIYSPAYEVFEKEHGHEFTYKLQDFIRETGVDPLKDIDSIAFGARPAGQRGAGVAVLTGAFSHSRDRIVDLLISKGRATVSSYSGLSVYGRPEESKGDEVATFLDDNHLLFGEYDAVTKTIDAARGTRVGVTGNPTLRQLIEKTNSDGTFWLVSTHTELFNRLRVSRQQVPEQMQQMQKGIPQIQNLILSGDLGNIVTASIRSQCKDAQAAQNLGDFVRGIVALGKMVTADTPDLAGLFQDIRVSQNENLVTLEISVPFEDLKKLRDMHHRRGLANAIKVF